MATVFISDLHLSDKRSDASRLFEQFAQSVGRRAEAIYILGDLFDAWIGDDVSPRFVTQELDALRELTGRGIPVYVMPGNRDFLMAEGFEAATGCQLIEDPMLLNLYGTRTVLTHGDALCTQDVEYQALRSQVRDPAWQRAFLAAPPQTRIATAQNLRDESIRRTGEKEAYIMDVTREAVEALMREYDARWMVHGHTHRPAVHELVLDGTTATRYVLGDWHHKADILVCEPGNCRLETLSLSR